MPSKIRLEVRSQYEYQYLVQFIVWSRGVNFGRATTSMGGPTTSRGRPVVVSACCFGVPVLPSARRSACVHNYERPVGCTRSSPLFSAFIFIFPCSFCLDTSSKILSKTKSFRFTIYTILVRHALVAYNSGQKQCPDTFEVPYLPCSLLAGSLKRG